MVFQLFLLTPYADVAIFRALVNAKDVIGESESTFGVDGEDLHFSATDKSSFCCKIALYIQS